MNVKKILDGYPYCDPEQLKQKIKAHRIVSFDIFDTLLKRDVASERDVFTLTEKLYNQRYQPPLFGFGTVRQEAERIVRKRAGGREITVQEIYTCIFELQRNCWKKEMIQKLMLLEKEVEAAVSCPNLLLKPIYQYCLDTKKEILIVSDMYLDKPFIASLLEKNGYGGYHALYVSSDIGKRKRDGTLFQYILGAEHLKPEEILHIGDGKKSDDLMPKRLGIHTAPIAHSIRKTRYLTDEGQVDRGVFYAFINNRVSVMNDRQYAIGYEVYGPLLYGFVSWLSKRLDPEKTALFFARDCYVILPAYRRLTGRKGKEAYFEGSRMSMITPALWKDSSVEQAVRLLRSEPKQMTLEGLMRKFGFSQERYLEVAQKHGLAPETVLNRDRLTQNENFVRFWDEIVPFIKKDLKSAYEGFQAYFQQLNCTEEIQVVDIGWRCTMQYCMRNLLPENYSLHGYYLGVREDAFTDMSECEGFFLNGENDEEKKAFLASVSALIEIFFSAPCGSVTGYAADGTPLHASYECAHDGSGRKLVKSLHEGALRFVEDFAGSSISHMIEMDVDGIFEGLRKMGSSPSREELIAFGNYPFRMGVGVVKAAAPSGLIFYAIHPRQLLYDFANSNWKIGFMRRLFKIKLPYEKIFGVIYRHR